MQVLSINHHWTMGIGSFSHETKQLKREALLVGVAIAVPRNGTGMLFSARSWDDINYYQLVFSDFSWYSSELCDFSIIFVSFCMWCLYHFCWYPRWVIDRSPFLLLTKYIHCARGKKRISGSVQCSWRFEKNWATAVAWGKNLILLKVTINWMYFKWTQQN